MRIRRSYYVIAVIALWKIFPARKRGLIRENLLKCYHCYHCDSLKESSPIIGRWTVPFVRSPYRPTACATSASAPFVPVVRNAMFAFVATVIISLTSYAG